MNNTLIWIGSPALFSVIGIIAGYLQHPDYTVAGACGGFVGGMIVAAFALAGENTKK